MAQDKVYGHCKNFNKVEVVPKDGVVIWEGTSSESGVFQMTRRELDLLKSFNVIRVIEEEGVGRGSRYILNRASNLTADWERFILTELTPSSVICVILTFPSDVTPSTLAVCTCKRNQRGSTGGEYISTSIKLIKIIGLL